MAWTGPRIPRPGYGNGRAAVERECETCKQFFLATLENVERGWGRFCSRHCKGIWQHTLRLPPELRKPRKKQIKSVRQLQPGEPIPVGEPKRYREGRGYIRLRWLVAPNTFVEVYEHRLLAGFPETTHHKNGDKGDNRSSNLQGISRSDHMKEHWARGDFANRHKGKEACHGQTPFV